jgi:hypothetical protein
MATHCEKFSDFNARFCLQIDQSFIQNCVNFVDILIELFHFLFIVYNIGQFNVLSIFPVYLESDAFTSWEVVGARGQYSEARLEHFFEHILLLFLVFLENHIRRSDESTSPDIEIIEIQRFVHLRGGEVALKLVVYHASALLDSTLQVDIHAFIGMLDILGCGFCKSSEFYRLIFAQAASFDIPFNFLFEG